MGFLCFSFSENFTNNVPAEQTNPNSIKTDTGTVDGIHYIFTISDTFYTFKGTFHTSASLDCLFDVSYQLKHKLQYKADNTKIELIEDHGNWYTTRYFINVFYYIENISEWVTSIDKPGKRIDFHMVQSRSNITIANVVRTSKGHYVFYPGKTGYNVEYYQECSVKESMAAHFYLASSKELIINYFCRYKRYMESKCLVKK